MWRVVLPGTEMPLAMVSASEAGMYIVIEEDVLFLLQYCIKYPIEHLSNQF